MSTTQYKDLLIQFYAMNGKAEEDVWSLVGVKELVAINPTLKFSNLFINHDFEVVQFYGEKFFHIC